MTQHITKTEGLCGGRPCIAGHRIRVSDVVVWHEELGMSPDEIVSEYPTITQADVHFALAYYHENPEEIREELRSSALAYTQGRANQESLLEARLLQRTS